MESTLVLEQGTPLSLGTSRSLTIEGTDQIWIVEAGKVDLFLQDLRDDGSHSARSHIARVEEGQAIFGFDTRSYPGLKLVVGIHPETKLFRVESATLHHTMSSPATSDCVLAMVKHWLNNLCIAASVKAVPTAPLTLEPGR